MACSSGVGVSSTAPNITRRNRSSCAVVLRCSGSWRMKTSRVAGVHVAVDSIDLGLFLQLDPQPRHFAKQRAQADGIGCVAVEAKEIDQIRFQALEVRRN